MQRRPRKDRRFRVSPSALVLAKGTARRITVGKRTRAVGRDSQGPFMPPENWHEPEETGSLEYDVIVQSPGSGYRHVVTADEVRERLSQLPNWMLRPLEIVQLSRMTRKKKTFPCYGMQWGSSLYLYPIEDSMVETFGIPPRPAVFNEARMYGGRWVQAPSQGWQLVWTEAALKDFYLNNILIHELGHLLDNRNRSYTDRERYAEWFAMEHGYRASRRSDLAHRAARRAVRRRHHST